MLFNIPTPRRLGRLKFRLVLIILHGLPRVVHPVQGWEWRILGKGRHTPDITNFCSWKISIEYHESSRLRPIPVKFYRVPAGSSANLGFSLLCTTKTAKCVAARRDSRLSSGYDESSASTSFFNSNIAYLQNTVVIIRDYIRICLARLTVRSCDYHQLHPERDVSYI